MDVSDVRSTQVSHATSLPLQRAPRASQAEARPASSTTKRGRAAPARARRTHAAGSRTAGRDPLLPGRAVVILALLTTTTLALLDRAWTGRLSQFFDLSFVLVCVLAALAVRRSGLFTVGVLPPLVLAAVFAILAVLDPATLTAQHVAVISTVLAALAHHAAALLAGHGSALAILVARGTLADEPTGST